MATAFNKVIFNAVYNAGRTTPSFVRIVDGGYSTIAGNEDEYGGSEDAENRSTHDGCSFIYDEMGRAVLHKAWHRTSTIGQWAYNHDTGLFERVMTTQCGKLFIDIGDRIGYSDANAWGAQYSAYYNKDISIGSPVNLMSAAWFGNSVIAVTGTTTSYRLSYPFTSAPSSFGSVAIHKVCVHAGKFWGLRIDTANGVFVYEYAAGNWVQRATFTDHSNAGMCNQANSHAFFSYGDYLYAVIGHNSTSTEMVTCWQIDPNSPYTATEISATVVPTDPNWAGVNPNGNVYVRIGNVPYIDDNGALQHVIVLSYAIATGANKGWGACLFSTIAKWGKIATGTETLACPGGVLWDTDAGTSKIVSVTDMGSYVRVVHRCAQITNQNIDVDIRYQKQDGTGSDIGSACTEYTGAGSEGKTDLTTKPSTPANLAALSDDFSSVFDATKYMKCNAAFDHQASGKGWYGEGGQWGGFTVAEAPILQQGGGVYFGTTPQATDNGRGASLMMRWRLTGDFTVDLTLDRLTSLIVGSNLYFLYAVVMSESNGGFGWALRSLSGTQFRAQGFYFRKNEPTTACVLDGVASVHDLVDTNVQRLSRASGVMSIINDYGGASEDITPVTPPVITLPMTLFFGAFPRTTSTWAATSIGPGFSNLAVSGAGAPGRYLGYVDHTFDWDAVADVGSVNAAYNLMTMFKNLHV